MPDQRRIPDDPLAFIRRCIEAGRILWTYHVNMRFGRGPITREWIINATPSFEVIEQYPEDKYLPSYLLRAQRDRVVFHVLIATDVEGDNVRIVTAYIPDASEWDEEFRMRRRKP